MRFKINNLIAACLYICFKQIKCDIIAYVRGKLWGDKQERNTMKKKNLAIILEIIPIISAIVALSLIFSINETTGFQKVIINITTLLGFLGFVFFIVGRKLARGDKAVLILGILDFVATAGIVIMYVLAILSFGL